MVNLKQVFKSKFIKIHIQCKIVDVIANKIEVQLAFIWLSKRIPKYLAARYMKRLACFDLWIYRKNTVIDKKEGARGTKLPL